MKRIAMQEASNVLALANMVKGAWPAKPIDPSKPFKWQTRRLVRWGLVGKVDPNFCQTAHVALCDEGGWVWASCEPTPAMRAGAGYLPRYQPGEVLAVGEKLVHFDCGTPVRYAADGVPVMRDGETPDAWPWKNDVLPSRYMPLWAARMWVQVMAVRVEQLQEITEGGACAEGVVPYVTELDYPGVIEQRISSYGPAFRELWEEIHGTWDGNLWVEVYEIMRVERPNGISQG